MIVIAVILATHAIHVREVAIHVKYATIVIYVSLVKHVILCVIGV